MVWSSISKAHSPYQCKESLVSPQHYSSKLYPGVVMLSPRLSPSLTLILDPSCFTTKSASCRMPGHFCSPCQFHWADAGVAIGGSIFPPPNCSPQDICSRQVGNNRKAVQRLRPGPEATLNVEHGYNATPWVLFGAIRGWTGAFGGVDNTSAEQIRQNRLLWRSMI